MVAAAPGFLADPPRFLLFTGKGGVGKTSVACASALALVRSGRRVLLVSTDPASNLGHVFGLTVGATVTEVPAVPGLSLLEIDPEQTAHAYRERIIGPVRNLLPAKEIESITEQLSGSCTTEIASFNEFTGLLADNAAAQFDHVVFDTAPTGHTIRLLQLPGEWTDFLNNGKGDASCLGPLSGLEKQRTDYAAAVAALQDPARSRLVLVARAQASTLAELDRTAIELAATGIKGGYIVLNALLPDPGDADPLAEAIYRREQAALAALPAALAELPCDRLELAPVDIVGLPALDRLFIGYPETGISDAPALDVPDAPLAALVDDLEVQGHGLILCMGKGGVGKTTVAEALAVALAARGHDVHLTTTDPAAHVDAAISEALGNLEVSRINPAEATAAYRERVLATKGATLDAQGRAVLAEDLQSPCIEEVAVFQAFSRIVHQSRRRFVVVDTAPTGHTLLLLDATGSYHREVARQMGETRSFTTPLMRLQDPDETKVVLVTLAETTPVLEAAELQADLARADITPWAWVVNNSVAAAGTESPLLRQRAQRETVEIQRVASEFATRFAVVPARAISPVGVPALAALTGTPAPSVATNACP
ncbi:arsenical pump-driving ATPase [Nocardia sp. 2]|uniref:Arsenical pump-driving ATPase n=1 Tax=Nocardia acididurans TaxID=2802282 RepID=A0ABS1M6U0_9NOCA|nr:arsenical pump-driving ATPase [Nocardia acididurans]MBL1076368.1 arsenical pump-driving ATPase [Nocardia acididurans]